MIPEAIARFLVGPTKFFEGLLQGALNRLQKAREILEVVAGEKPPADLFLRREAEARVREIENVVQRITPERSPEDLYREYRRIVQRFSRWKKYTEDEFPYDAFVEGPSDLKREFRVIARIDYYDDWGELRRQWITLDFDEPRSIRELREEAENTFWGNAEEYAGERRVAHIEGIEFEEFWRRPRGF